MLRDYQNEVIADVDRRIAAGVRRLIIVAPTGSGKTVIASAIIRALADEGRRVLVLAHRREIVGQTSRKLHDNGVTAGIIMAGVMPSPLEPVQVAAVQTLHARAMRSDAMVLPPADLVVVDECHHATARTWRAIIEAYPNATLIGLTATPARGDGRGLGGIFDALVECPQVQALIDAGYLVPTRVYAPATPDLTGVRVQAGDWNEHQLAERMDRPQLVGDIIGHWHRLAEGRRTVVFATGVQHSIHIRDEFLRSGVRAAHLDGSTPKDERDDILHRLGVGDLDVVTNAMVLIEGWDLPDLGAIVLARPTRKLGLFRQMIGRGLRPADGKTDCIIIDHSGATYRHGFAEDDIAWTLDPEDTALNLVHERRSTRDFHSRLVDCAKCGALRTAGEACRHCGFKPAPPPRAVAVIDGDLAHVTRGGTRQRVYSPEDKVMWRRMLTFIGIERNYKPGWAAHKFKEKFGEWPPFGSVPPLEPTPEVRSWVRSRQIAYAKARTKGAAA